MFSEVKTLLCEKEILDASETCRFLIFQVVMFPIVTICFPGENQKQLEKWVLKRCV